MIEPRMMIPIAIATVAVAISIKRRLVHPPRRIESPAKRAIENSIARHERVRIEPRIPVPSGSPPRRSAGYPSILRVVASLIDVGFGHVRGSQAAPLIQIVAFVRLAVELLRHQHSIVPGDQLMS